MSARAFQFLCGVLVMAAVNCGGPDLSQYEHLKTPQISQKAPQQMLVTELTGDPNETTGTAFGALYSAYYDLDDAKVDAPWPRSRWPLNLVKENIPMSQWRGTFAVPVAKAVTELPAEYTTGNPPVRLETWDYGTVAELMHVGPFDKLSATSDKLEAYIKAEGYRIVGKHEEEYLKGPGLIFQGNPDEYHTIIRYEVAR